MFRHSLHWLTAIFFVLIANAAHAQAGGYLCIADAGYKGESQAVGFTNCSEISGFGQTGFLDGSTPIARDLKITKLYDTMSNPLRTAMVNRTTLSEVKIRLVRQSGGPALAEFSDVRLLGAHVDSEAMSWSVGGDGPATDTIGFSAASIEVKYAPMTNAGTLGTAVYTCWNVAANTATNSTCP